MQTDTQPNTRVRRVRQKEKNHHVKSEMRKRVSPSNTFQEQSPGKRRCRSTPVAVYHTRGTGRIPRENNKDGERPEQYITRGVKFVSRRTRHDEMRHRKQ